MTQPAVYKRVLLKLSGEALMGRREFGLDNDMVERHRQRHQGGRRHGRRGLAS